MPTLQQALHTYLLIERRPATTTTYRRILSRLVAAIGPARDITRISYEDLLDYQATIRATLKPSSVKTYIDTIKAFFSWCVKRKYIAVSPAEDIFVRRPPSASGKSRAIPGDELARMVEYARLTSPRNYAILLFLIDTGCRAGGLCSLTIDNLDLQNYRAVLVEKGGKTQQVRFYTETAAALEAWLKVRQPVDHGFIFTSDAPHYGPFTPRAVNAMMHRLSVKIGASRQWGPHGIRHAVGHAYAAQGVPPTVTRDKLGHSNVMTTLNYYYPQDEEYLELMSRRLTLAPLKSAERKRNVK